MQTHVELHILQNFAPSCLNRDDANAPKDCVFGGYRRARISSQCIKRAIRFHPTFAECVGGQISRRTKRLVHRLSGEIARPVGANPETTQPIVAGVVANTLVPLDKQNRTNVLLFLGEDEVGRLRQLILDNWETLAAAAEKGDKALKKAAAAATKDFQFGTRSVDVALFGRMIADKPEGNIEAACQVAHAISTHRADMEMDFYTAVDDLNPTEETGAGMMGTIEFNSACFYRYSLLDFHQLLGTLSGNSNRPSAEDVCLARAAAEGFLRASIFAIPTGRQHSMAAQNLPIFVFAVVRNSGVPCSLTNAFEVPVKVSDYDPSGLVEKSIEALANHWAALDEMYGIAQNTTCAACWLGEAKAEPLADYRVPSVEELIARVINALPADGGE